MREEAKSLISATDFWPEFMSLTKPLPIWSSCGSNPFEVRKVVIAARMLLGRYLTDQRQRHWTQNRAGICLLPSCAPPNSQGSLEHLLLWCSALAPSRLKLLKLAEKVSSREKTVADILLQVLYFGTTKTIMQILLDCSVLPEIVRHTQNHGTSVGDLIFYFGRTCCYYIHRERMKQMGLLNLK